MSEQIKETEIMIGNYYQYMFNDKIVKAESILKDENWHGGYVVISECGQKTAIAACIPIPLTEDILLKAGFKVSMNKTCYGMITESGKTRLSIFHDGLFKVSCEDLEIKVKYLHQLQNLFKALTQTDLKVEV